MGKKKTHEEYVEELASKNPNIEVLETYVNATTKIMHRCLIDNYEWYATPSKILSGSGCPKCGGKFRRTHKDYVDEVISINPNIEVIGEFKGMREPILHKCLIHDVEWLGYPENILKGCGCKECTSEKITSKSKKTHEQYEKELEESNPNIIAIEKYSGATTPILHKCLIDGYEWRARPANILFGTGCPKCGGKIKLTTADYIDRVALVNPNIEVLGEYINAKTPILHFCKKHNIKWDVVPSSILQGCGCIECGKEKFSDSNRKTHTQYVEELALMNKNIIAIENYSGANNPILHKCLIDGCEWSATPGNILSGHGCPQCNESKGERDIRLWLDEHHIAYELQYRFADCRDVKPLLFDFYLTDRNIAIEYDGAQHYKAVDYFGGDKKLEYTIKHDTIKNEYCKNNGIELLRIPYFKNIEEELNNFLFI